MGLFTQKQVHRNKGGGTRTTKTTNNKTGKSKVVTERVKYKTKSK
jgi:hypothetical protein